MTRRTFEQTKESLEFMEKIDGMTKEQREHLRLVVKKLVDCYIDDKQHAIVVAGSDDSDRAHLITINCNEMDASVMLAKLDVVYTELNMADVPPKEMLN
jgi:predicted nucleotidyltransferase